MPLEQDFTSQGGMEREGEGGKKGLHNEIEVEEGGCRERMERPQEGKKKERSMYKGSEDIEGVTP